MALWPSLLSRTFSVLVFGFVVLNCFVVDKFGSHAQGVTPLLPVDEDFVPPSENSSSTGTSAGNVVGIVAAIVVVIFLILGILWWNGCSGPKISRRHDSKGPELKRRSFALSEMNAATKNFDPNNKIGEGGFGPVYKGLLPDGTVVAVKRLSCKSNQGNRPEEYQLNLDWATRHKICVGIARGLVYLLEESRLKIVHRDIKPTNVLLDRNLDPKISDFGLAKLYEEDKTHISTRVAGTFGYMAPEYARRGRLTDKADVYSFGIVALVIVSGKSSTSHRTREDSVSLLDRALVLKKKGTLLELVDPKLGQDYNKEEAITMIKVALLCSNASATDRPAMSSVVSMLEGKTAVQDFDIPDDSMSTDERIEAFSSYQRTGKK